MAANMYDKPKNDFNFDTRYEVELADVGTRFVGLAVDSIIVGIITGILTLGSQSFWGTIIGLIVGVGYQWYFLTANRGQTPGKMLVGIRVIHVDGSPLTATDAAIRYVGYYINSVLAMLGWVWAIFDERKQGFHDKLVNTIVVKA